MHHRLAASALATAVRMRVANVPVTHGSNPQRQLQRHHELSSACQFLGWDLLSSPPAQPDLPKPAHTVESICDIFKYHQPDLILFPHAKDWNSTHLTTHRLLMDALSLMPNDFSCHVLETEFWGAMDDPNLMVEASTEHLSRLVAATAHHQGEIIRNPYHLTLPAWMIDNVRRGAERILGQGSNTPPFTFATLYRHSQWKNGTLHPHSPAILPASSLPDTLFP